MVARKPRVVVVGAGMAGLAAASHLQRLRSGGSPCLDVTVLEAGPRIGGRIHTARFGGDQVELGATWIHGIDGSPVYAIAKRIHALHGDTPWERQDGFPAKPAIRAEGGFTVDPALIEGSRQLYKKLMCEIRDEAASVERQQQRHGRHESVGEFLREGLNTYLLQQELGAGCVHTACNGWSLRSLHDGVFSMHESMERIATAVNSLFDLDLESEKEYREYPGEHLTLGGGYASVVQELASSLHPGTIEFGKRVSRCFWHSCRASSNAPVLLHCTDGSAIEADHVIITVSLGVLKAGCLPSVAADPCYDRPVCKSVHELPARIPIEGPAHQLFEPPLPLWKLGAISRLGFGVVDKLFLRLDSAADEQLRSHVQLICKRGPPAAESIPWWMKKTFSLSPIYDRSNVLLAWFAGEEALELESLSDSKIIAGVVQTLDRFGFCRDTADGVVGGGGAGQERKASDSSSDSEESSEDGDTERRAGGGASVLEKLHRMFAGALRSTWARDPLFYGSYTYAAVGSSGRDFDTLAEPLPGCGEEGQPLQLLFAGEATERHFYSTTHGAYLSGVREANRLLLHYGFPVVEPP